MIRCMKKYSHIDIAEREKIFLYFEEGKSCRQIGRLLGRDHKAISSEVKRNSFQNPGNSEVSYSPSTAQTKYDQRRRNSKKRKLDDPATRHYVVDKLGDGWSPEQISGRLKRINKTLSISYETIYEFIYSKEARPYRYHEFLRRGHTKRRKKDYRRTKSSKRLEIPNRR